MFDGFWKSVEEGKWEPYTFQVLDRFLTPETNVLDIGAWIGPVTLYAANKAKHVLAVEPDPIAFTELCRAALSLQNVALYETAVLDKIGLATFGSPSLGDSTTRLGYPNNVFEVECVTLESLGRYVPDPLFIKMDVEGAEEIIIESPIFEKRKPTLYLSVHWPMYKNPARVEQRIDELKALYSNYEVIAEGNYGTVLFS